MTYEEFVRNVAKASGVSQKDTKAVIAALTDELTTQISDGEVVRIPKLGVFKTQVTAARTGRNPRTGEPLEIPAKNRPNFSPAKELAEAVHHQLPRPIE